MSPRASARLLLLLLGLAPLALGAARPRGLRDVRAVRHWSYADFTRVSIELSGEPRDVRLDRLAPDPETQRPERIYLDLEGVWVGTRFNHHPIPVGDGLLAGVRLGQNTLTATRVVIDLERYERHRVLRLHSPERVVIDVFGPRPAAAPQGTPSQEASAPPVGPAPAAAEPVPAARLPMDLRPVRTVVVDAGHGGHDPGALGLYGLREKDVTLRLARLLAERLRQEAFRVVLTRDTDRTLDLEERTAIAEGANGDVFVSLHLNAAESRRLHGVETYYLDEGYERHAITVAARENGVRPWQVNDLQRTVAQLRVSEASGHSAALAGMVHQEIMKGLHRRYGNVEDLGVKKGPFYVLFLSSMPSILIETGFLTNREDARRLRDPAYLRMLVDEIARGLVRYRETAGPMVARSSR